MKNAPVVQLESLSPTDPRDFRHGVLFGSLLVLLGGIAAALVVVGLIATPFGVKDVSIIVSGLIAAGEFAIPGFLLIHRGKLGLWIMYLLSGFFAYEFCRAAIHAPQKQARDDIYGIYISGALMALWLSIAKYFYNRRALFTGWWRSEDVLESQGE
ncbi:MAG TPA: hypothetical protein VJR23_04675 [Candidatus Acidoferrales bacterium]|nr:hypothetical protein [Candidatus Acidoferrales bacterium]